MEKKGGGRSYDIIKVDALILRQKSKPFLVGTWMSMISGFLSGTQTFSLKPNTAISYFNRKL